MSVSLVVEKATKEDAESLVMFNCLMAKETEDKELDKELVSKGVRRMFTEGERLGFYLVCKDQDEICGSLMITFEWSDWRNACFWWIQSVFVKKSHRRKGVYSKLYETVQELAKKQGEANPDDKVCGFRLYVEHDNEVAQQVYKKCGMDKSHYFMYSSAE